MSIALGITPPYALSDYAALKAHIAEKMDRSDLTDQIPNFIRLGEFMLFDKIFHPLADTTALLVTVAGVESLTLPSDFRQMRSAHVTGDPVQYLSQVSSSALREDWPSGRGSPQAFALTNGSMLLGPSPDAAYTISLNYTAELQPLSDSAPTNWLLQRRADLYTYAALLQAEAHILNDERIPLWKSALDEGVAELNAAGRRYRMSASPLRIRNPVYV